MRFKQKLEEARPKHSLNKTDIILLKSAARSIIGNIRKAIDNYMHQIDIPDDADMKWKKEIKLAAYKEIVNNLSKMEKDI